MNSDTLKLFLVVSVLLVKIHDTNVNALQGYFFDVIANTSLIAGTLVATFGNHMECALRCGALFGQGICKTASFCKTSHICQMSSGDYDISAVQQDLDSVTLRFVGQACGQPVISNSNMGTVNSVYGTVVTVECGDGYTATNENITCQENGTWSLTECSQDCGTITVANAVTSYTNGITYVGSIATVACNANYALTDNNITMEMLCTASGWTSQTGVTPVCWELMFRGTQGNGFDLIDIYLYGNASSDMTGMTTSHPICQNVFDTSCNLHYRNPELDIWTSLNVQQVRYELYNDSQTVMSITIAAAG